MGTIYHLEALSAIRANDLFALHECAQKLDQNEISRCLLISVHMGNHDASRYLVKLAIDCNAIYKFNREPGIPEPDHSQEGQSNAYHDILIRNYADVADYLFEAGHKICFDKISKDVIYQALHRCNSAWKLRATENNQSFKNRNCSACAHEIAI